MFTIGFVFRLDSLQEHQIGFITRTSQESYKNITRIITRTSDSTCLSKSSRNQMKSLLDLVQSKTRGIQLIKQKLEYDSVSLVVKANQIQANQSEIESIINEMDQLQEQILEIETIVTELEKYLFEFQ